MVGSCRTVVLRSPFVYLIYSSFTLESPSDHPFSYDSDLNFSSYHSSFSGDTQESSTDRPFFSGLDLGFSDSFSSRATGDSSSSDSSFSGLDLDPSFGYGYCLCSDLDSVVNSSSCGSVGESSSVRSPFSRRDLGSSSDDYFSGSDLASSDNTSYSDSDLGSSGYPFSSGLYHVFSSDYVFSSASYVSSVTHSVLSSFLRDSRGRRPSFGGDEVSQPFQVKRRTTKGLGSHPLPPVPHVVASGSDGKS